MMDTERIDERETAFSGPEWAPGQAASRSAWAQLQAAAEKPPWWVLYLDLRAEGWRWGPAALIAWLTMPRTLRRPESFAQLAELLGTSERTLRKWRSVQDWAGRGSIDERARRLQLAELLEYRGDVIRALGESASDPAPQHAQDRKTYFTLSGDLVERRQDEVSGSVKLYETVSPDDWPDNG